MCLDILQVDAFTFDRQLDPNIFLNWLTNIE